MTFALFSGFQFPYCKQQTEVLLKDVLPALVGGGASTLVDDLIQRGYCNVKVLAISQIAPDVAKERLGKAAEAVRWLRADVAQSNPPESSFGVWHDRAVFYFLTSPEERVAYKECREGGQTGRSCNRQHFRPERCG